mmetsp:Transcript_10320/g.31928  ORF Transcript_10320/g.31928 Transcript_10320/m.31928 type:complete len:133 (-) Transcript_10320:413-811(-)
MPVFCLAGDVLGTQFVSQASVRRYSNKLRGLSPPETSPPNSASSTPKRARWWWPAALGSFGTASGTGEGQLPASPWNDALVVSHSRMAARLRSTTTVDIVPSASGDDTTATCRDVSERHNSTGRRAFQDAWV